MAQINKPTDYFNTKLYTGNGTDDRNITGVGFQPDFLWLKERSDSRSHRFVDSVRGSSKLLFSDQTLAEVTDANEIQAFNSDGFQVGTDVAVNDNSETYVAWNWLAGGSASSNTDGSITSSVSASTTSGFSIVSYTGTGANATVGHGLGEVPKCIIVKSRSGTNTEWQVYHSSIGNTKSIQLNATAAPSTSSNFWNDTTPTSSVFSLGAATDTNGSSATMIAYCFAEKKGYSKFGSYTGNGNADGTFVYTGFKPAMVIVKVTSTTNNWNIFDNKRSPINDIDKRLFPNLSNAEQTGTASIDFLSNGFKCRNTNDNYNASGATYIYMAFAEQPLVGTNNIPATAR